MKRHQTNDAVVTSSTLRLTAIEKHLKKQKVVVPVDGKRLKPAALVATYARALASRDAVVTALSAYKAALAERDDAEAARLSVDNALKSWVLHYFGASSTEAAEFGFAAPKTPDVSTATRAKAILLGKATREARGTMGRKKKLQIKGKLPPDPPATEATPAHSPEKQSPVT